MYGSPAKAEAEARRVIHRTSVAFELNARYGKPSGHEEADHLFEDDSDNDGVEDATIVPSVMDGTTVQGTAAGPYASGFISEVSNVPVAPESAGTAANGAGDNAQPFKRRCIDENAVGAIGSSRSMSTMSARCADDLLLDHQRCAVRKRPVDDIRLDRKRMRRTDADAGSYDGSQTAPISQDVVILQRSSEMSVNCIVMLEAQDAPT